MKRYLFLITLLGATLIPSLTKAQTTAEFHAGLEKYWKEDIVRLKKIKSENDNHAAAQLVRQLKDEILPMQEKVTRATQEWKKSHSQQEFKQEVDWEAGNPLLIESSSLQSDVMMKCSTAGGELTDAWKDYMHSMMTMIKRTK